MRFLVLSDIHGREKVAAWASEKARDMNIDAILILGDITHFGPAEWAGKFLDMLPKPVYAIPGNCDPPQVIDQIKGHAVSLHTSKIDIGGTEVIGLGGSNPTIFETPFELQEDEIDSSLRPLMEKDAVLVLHAPPFGINDTIPTGDHVGSTAIRRIVDEYHPKAVLSGHIHEARGILRDNGCVFMNPGPAKDGHSGLLTIDGSTIKAELLDQWMGTKIT